jgi:hypothetical protein
MICSVVECWTYTGPTENLHRPAERRITMEMLFFFFLVLFLIGNLAGGSSTNTTQPK